MTDNPAQMPVILAKNVNKIFKPSGAEQVIALQNINLTVQAGEFVSLIGPSGCGNPPCCG